MPIFAWHSMKFTIKTKVLLDNLKDVGRALPTRTTIPILQSILFRVTSKQLILTASNADMTIVRTINTGKKTGLKISKTGLFALKGKFTTKIVSEMPNKMITFATSSKEDHVTSVSSGHTIFSLNTIDGTNYPHLPKLNDSTSLSLSGAILNNIIAKTAFASSTQENQPTLTGVHFNLTNSKLTVVATDSHRLSQYAVNLKDTGIKSFDVNIPASNLKELSSLVDDKDSVTMDLADTQLLFKFKNTAFYSRSLEGRYPDTSNLINTNHKTQIFVDANYLLDVVSRASLISHSSQNNVVAFNIDPTSKVAHVKASGGDVGTDNELIPVDSFTGGKLQIASNPDYIMDALKAIGNHKIVVNFISALRPMTIVPLDDKNKPLTNFVQLITPIRTF